MLHDLLKQLLFREVEIDPSLSHHIDHSPRLSEIIFYLLLDGRSLLEDLLVTPRHHHLNEIDGASHRADKVGQQIVWVVGCHPRIFDFFKGLIL